MRVVIDWNLCVGAGLCLAPAAGGLRLVPYPGQLRAVLVGSADDGALLAAARACPTMAIRLAGQDGRPIYPPAGA